MEREIFKKATELEEKLKAITDFKVRISDQRRALRKIRKPTESDNILNQLFTDLSKDYTKQAIVILNQIEKL